MPRAGYFTSMVGAIILGILALIAAGILFWIALPYLVTIFVGTMMLILGFIMIFTVVYIALFVGVAIYYAIKHPMVVEKKDKKYSISKARESGRREKGNS